MTRKNFAFCAKSYNSPLKEYSDCVIEVEDDNPLDDRNMKPTLYFAKTMMMIELLIYEYYRISIK